MTVEDEKEEEFSFTAPSAIELFLNQFDKTNSPDEGLYENRDLFNFDREDIPDLVAGMTRKTQDSLIEYANMIAKNNAKIARHSHDQSNIREIYEDLNNELKNSKQELEDKEQFLSDLDEKYTERYKEITGNLPSDKKISAKIDDEKLAHIRKGQEVCQGHIKSLRESIQRYEVEIAECVQDSEAIDADISFIIDDTQEVLEDASATILRLQRQRVSRYEYDEEDEENEEGRYSQSLLSTSVNNRWNSIKSEVNRVLETEYLTDKSKTVGVIKAMEMMLSRPGEEFEESRVISFCDDYDTMMDLDEDSTTRILASQNVIAKLVQYNIVETNKQTGLLKRLLDHYRIYTKL